MNKFLEIKELLDYLFGSLFIEDTEYSLDKKNKLVKNKEDLICFFLDRGEYYFQTSPLNLKKMYRNDKGSVLLENCSFFHRPAKNKLTIKWEIEEEIDIETAFFEYVVRCPPIDLESVRLVSENRKNVYKAEELDLDKKNLPKKTVPSNRPNRPKPSPPWVYSPTKSPSIHKPRGVI